MFFMFAGRVSASPPGGDKTSVARFLQYEPGFT
jgi:hypothetical protein